MPTHWLVGVGVSDPRASFRSVYAWSEESAIDVCAPTCNSAEPTACSACGGVLPGDQPTGCDEVRGWRHGRVCYHPTRSTARRACACGQCCRPLLWRGAWPRGRSGSVCSSVAAVHRNSVGEALPLMLGLHHVGCSHVFSAKLKRVPHVLVSLQGHIGKSEHDTSFGDALYYGVDAYVHAPATVNVEPLSHLQRIANEHPLAAVAGRHEPLGQHSSSRPSNTRTSPTHPPYPALMRA